MKQNLKVYLAGSMTYNWRAAVKNKCSIGIDFINPMEHKLSDPKQYTIWDLEAVKQSDIVFCVMEESNPSGYGLTLELGYGKALGKTTILCDTRSYVDTEFLKKFEIVRNAADILFGNLDEAVEYLKSFTRM